VEELDVVLKARKLVKQLGQAAMPVDLQAYLNHIDAVVRYESDLESDGMFFENKGKKFICVKSDQLPVRQRFTICHKIAHVVLDIPSDHQAPRWSYAKRPKPEILCDIFAAELLLPYELFKKEADRIEIGLTSVDELAKAFQTSKTATASRFAAVLSAPCAFVLSEGGEIRYVGRSNSLREGNAWIQPSGSLPRGSITVNARTNREASASGEVDSGIWLHEWDGGGTLREEVAYSRDWDQTLTLLWFENGQVPHYSTGEVADEDDGGLAELDGNLRWPSKRRR
jgi:hypothetical protein